MSYFSVSVVVDGALSEYRELSSEYELAEFLVDVEDVSAGLGCQVDVFALWHDHPRSGASCECAQYQTDHRPILSISPE